MLTSCNSCPWCGLLGMGCACLAPPIVGTTVGAPVGDDRSRIFFSCLRCFPDPSLAIHLIPFAAAGRSFDQKLPNAVLRFGAPRFGNPTIARLGSTVVLGRQVPAKPGRAQLGGRRGASCEFAAVALRAREECCGNTCTLACKHILGVIKKC
jgi:hypothetical protein